MRVEDVKRNNINNVAFFQDQRRVERSKDSFSNYVKQLEKDEIINRIKELINKIDSLGKSLAERLDLSTLKE